MVNLTSLQSELDTCKNSREEELCRELNKELEELQRECYHKQMKLQTARQSRNTPLAGNRKTLHSAYQQPEPDNYSETFTESNLVDDEWFEAGMLDDFDSNDEGDIECDWDIVEAELEQDMILDCQPNSDRTDVEKFPAKLVPHRNAPSAALVARDSSQTEKNRSKVQFRKPVSSSEMRELSNPGYSLSSPCSRGVPRKRPGESIFKAPKAINNTSR